MCLGTAGQIVQFEDADRQTATVDIAGTHHVVNTGMVAGDADPPGPGDWVLVHLGMALQRMTPEEVAQVRSSYDELMADFDVIAAGHDAGHDAEHR